MRSLIITALFVLTLSACTHTKLYRMSENQLHDVRSSKIATSTFIVEKKIHYAETLYRVFWLENKSATFDYSGIWNPDQALTNVVSNALLETDLHSDSLYNLVDSELVDNYLLTLKADYLSNTTGDLKQIRKYKVIPEIEYFEVYPDSPEFEQVRLALLATGHEYLFEYLTRDLYSFAPGLGKLTVYMPSQLRIIDLQQKTVIWTFTTEVYESEMLGGDFRKIEANGLEKLKSMVKGNIEKVVNPELVSKSFGPKS